MHTLDPRSPLVVDTRQLDRRAGSSKRLRRTLDAPAGLAVPSARVPAGSALTLDVELDSVVDGIWVAGTASFRVLSECIRCLEETEQALTAELEALYVTPAEGDARGRGDRHTAGRAPLEQDEQGDDDLVFALDGDFLDLEQVVRDGVVLALPLRPLCRPDCAGLNLDGLRVEESGRAPAPVDPRWAALSGWSGPAS